MPSRLSLSPMQREYLRSATHRWNVKTGATRSGKTFLDQLVVIPKRILNCTGDGHVVLIGNTQNTLTRNVLEPMRALWGTSLVGGVASGSNEARLFGRKCIVLGADTKTAVKRLQGMSIEYCYGDEVATWHEDVFTMLKSRMDKPNARFDGTCNPDAPTHWFKAFLDSDADIYQQAYTLDDNPFLPPAFVADLKKEYAGTVYYDRFIRGLWVAAQGVIYRDFADNPDRFVIGRPGCPLGAVPGGGDLISVAAGLDFGGRGSGTALVARAYTRRYRQVIVLSARRETRELNPIALNELVVAFLQRVLAQCGRCDTLYCDSAETTLIHGVQYAVERARLPVSVRNARKAAINDRIRLTASLLAQGRLLLTEDCAPLEAALRTAMWDGRIKTEDIRLDDGTTDIDSLDAFEYTIERDGKTLLPVYGGGKGERP